MICYNIPQHCVYSAHQTRLTQHTYYNLLFRDQAMQYEQQVRDYHKALRLFYYPLLFSKDPFTLEKLNNRPEFSAYSASQPSPKDNS